MNQTPWWVIAARTLGIAIAIAGTIDPAITSRRVTRAEIAVVAAEPARDSATVARVIRALGKGYTVTAAPLASADATVLVGDAIPRVTDQFAEPIFAIMSDRNGTALSITALDAPAIAPLNAKTPITASVHVLGMRGNKIELTLRAGDVVVDRTERSAASNDEQLSVPLAFAPTAAGVVALRVTASSGGKSVNADVAVDVRDQRWSVLFYDPRASWQSTFVRRAIEEDNRFVVTSRTVTSRNISSSTGSAPVTLDDPAGVARYDAIVIGAPDALSERDVAALENLLRRRAASVVFLLDQKGDGPYQRLTGASAWRSNGSGRTESVLPAAGTAPGDSISLRAAELFWPAHLPPGATAIAFDAPARGDSTPRAPVIWQVPVGAGRLIVSGALDAWRYRDPAVSSFDPFWRTEIAAAASSAPPPVAATIAPALLAPGESATLSVAVRDLMLQSPPAHATATATWQSAAGASTGVIRHWPRATGEFTGEVRAPTLPGSYRVAVTVDGHAAAAAFVVAPVVAHAAPDERDLLAAWTRAHGGAALAAGDLAALPAALRRAIHQTPQPIRWHPVRSIWWLFPFVLCLSAEWWWRRRNGRR